MEENFQNLRRKHKDFTKGEADALTVRDEALSVLKEAKKRGDEKILREIEDMLLELESSIQENTCKCHRKSSIC
ncbi:MAG: hypothetical protein PVF15_09190 [Candidatus Bathyarchaeota archaeon]|jgi:polyhydroxyalkanoate synthesis regulator phasin